MSLETNPLNQVCSLILLGDEHYPDRATINRTIVMVRPYKHIMVHTILREGAVHTAIVRLMRMQHPSLRVKEYITLTDVLEGALELGKRHDCRTVCFAYWNGKDTQTLAHIQGAAAAGVEIGIVPCQHARKGTLDVV